MEGISHSLFSLRLIRNYPQWKYLRTSASICSRSLPISSLRVRSSYERRSLMMPSIIAGLKTPRASNIERWLSRQSAEAAQLSGNYAKLLSLSAFSFLWIVTLT